MRRRHSGGAQGGFTLMELLVVIGIMAAMMAMALPAMSKFLKGQKLNQAGRIVQSAFNEARRAAITQRARHYLYFCRTAGMGGNPDTFSLCSYREGFGWETTMVQLPSTVVPLLTGQTSGYSWPASGTPTLASCNLPVLDITNGGLPPATAGWPGIAAFDGSQLTPTSGAVFEFRKDGTLNPKNGALDIPAPASGTGSDIYDLNQPITYTNPTTTQADIVLLQVGETSKRCYIDIDVNTGRVRFRVLETDSSLAPGATQGG
jgi:prepilin-type N-terminal cleavage/methylation domain-containing protein